MEQVDLDHRVKEMVAHLRALNARSAKIHSAINVLAWLIGFLLIAFLVVNAEHLYAGLVWLKSQSR